jgi:hypothetical protein
VLALVALGIQLSVTIDHRLSVVNFFSFFTNLSNILGAVVLVYLAVRPGTGDLVRGAATTYLAITGIVYNLLLRGEDLGVLKPWINVVLHVVTPIVMLLDWLLDPPGRPVPLRRALWWLAFPLAYVGYSLIRGAVVHWYPYPFLNPAHPGGYARVLGFAVGIAVAFVAVIAALTQLGNRLAARRLLPRRS